MSVIRQARDILIYLHLKYHGDWDRIYQDIKDKEYVDDFIISKDLTEKFVTIIDEEYPKDLRNIVKPSFAIDRREVEI